MATLRIEAGPYVFEQVATNANADRVVLKAATRMGYSGDIADKQAILDYVGAGLVSYLTELAFLSERTTSVDEAVAVSGVDVPVWD